MHTLRFGVELTHVMTAEKGGNVGFTTPGFTGGPYRDAADSGSIFIHGLLGPRRIGSCSSLPVLYAAVARRLGYPVKLVLTVQHIFNRWVSRGESFNMDGCAKFISNDGYEHYIDWPRKWNHEERTCRTFLRPATPREELAAFVFTRCIGLSANLEFDEAYRVCKIASKLSPQNPAYRQELETIEGYQLTKQSRLFGEWKAICNHLCNPAA